MESLPLSVLERATQENESTLRASFDGEAFPAEWDQDLAALPRETQEQKLVYYARVKHWYWIRYEDLNQAQPAANRDSQDAAASKLLRREPVVTTLAGRRVPVTGRSYNALAEIAAHQMRINELHVAVGHIETLHRNTLVRHSGFFRRRRVSNRLALLRRCHTQLFSELLAHRRALYAHALTPSGGAAVDVDEGHPAPWWRETSIEDDARLLIALVEVGPVRYHQLGEVARTRKSGRSSEFAEDFGFHSLLTWVEGKRHLQPAALYNQDVGQILAAVRAGSLADAATDSLEA